MPKMFQKKRKARRKRKTRKCMNQHLILKMRITDGEEGEEATGIDQQDTGQQRRRSVDHGTKWVRRNRLPPSEQAN